MSRAVILGAVLFAATVALRGAQPPLPAVGSDPLHRPLDEILDVNVRDGMVYYRALDSGRNDEQVRGWKQVTDSVHHAGGRIVAQLWHMGRLVHPDLGGGQPVSSSATTSRGRSAANG